jgi:hypothetical protein
VTSPGVEKFNPSGSVKFVARAFRICAPSVVSEVIDGEAVIMDLRSGNYFSASETGGEIWRDIEAGRSYPQILRSLTARYQIDLQTLTDATDRFVTDLLANHLVEEIMVEESADIDPAHSVASPVPAFRPPALEMYTDLQDLLLLDPIHDVDAVGWPTRKT